MCKCKNNRRAANAELRSQLELNSSKLTEKGKELVSRIQELDGLKSQYEGLIQGLGSKVRIIIVIS